MNKIDLRSHLESYLALRGALGYSAEAERRRLLNFVESMEAQRVTNAITVQLALDWACSSPRCGTAGQARRLTIVRGFLYYVRAFVPETEIPGPGLLASPSRQSPYIYTSAEIKRLLEAAQELRPMGSLRPYTYTTLVGLLVSTGLRIGEVVRLNLADIRLDDKPPLILVLKTKFRKSRAVPIHSTTSESLRRYAEQRGSCDEEAFFVSQRGRRLSRSAIWRSFDTMRCCAGIQPTTDGRRPTLHALRHTFAVNRLVAWYRQGIDVNAWLPHLSVYLGHAEPKDTYWYLTATPELLSFAADSFNHYANEAGAL